MTLGQYVRQYREEHNLSQRKFAEMCGLSNAYISILEDGKSPKTGKNLIPKLDSLLRISNTMGITFKELCNDIEIEESSVYEIYKAEELQITDPISEQLCKLKVSNIAERIGEALRARQMRPSELCKVAKIPQSSLSLYLSGAYEPKQDRVYAMASALNVDVNWLLGYDLPMGTFLETLKQADKYSTQLSDREKDLLFFFRLLTDEEQEHILQTEKMIAKK